MILYWLVFLLLSAFAFVESKRVTNNGFLDSSLNPLWFFIIISLVIFNYLFSNLLDYMNHRNWKDEIPNELKDFYDKEKYRKK